MRLLVFVIGLIIPTVAIAGPTASSLSEHWAPRGLTQHPAHWPEPGHLEPPSQCPKNATEALQKRSRNLQIKFMKVYQLAVPIRQASLHLSYFYSYILRESAANWLNLGPQTWVRVTYGSFAFTIQSIGGPIPWPLIGEVAINMQAITMTGFTGTYDLFYADDRFAGVLI
ncbi:MAG: hypothetical protein Q9191_001148, partial [Dirinaria sp. TL-2023a]